uniref:DNA repair protein REV1 n=1 Tax=Panagrellus redivivus TaxID=6233 RepID=A0A7E4VG16_PANRE
MEEALTVLGDPSAPTVVQRRTHDLGLRVGDDGNFRSFGDYMHAKVSKLLDQCHSGVPTTSAIFAGISIYVDGHTDPPSHELRRLIIENGGEYHHYYLHGRTTYQVAANLAKTKVERLRASEKIIKPEYITDCLKKGRLLPEGDYLLFGGKENAPNNANVAPVQQFFNRSRLHLISTMATELKRFVATMQANEAVHEFPSRAKLGHLVGPVIPTTPIICHIDMDCFFVSVALRSRPELIGKPVAVTHSSANSNAYGEIASCSYEARAHGVYARQFVREAMKTCPDLVCVPYEFDAYVATAKQLYSTLARYTLALKAISCDELYFDLGALCAELSITDPLAIISIIRAEITAVTGCVASAGLGPNWLVARLATKKAKPAGQVYVTAEEAPEFVQSLPISDLPSVGWSNCETIQEQLGANVTTCRQLVERSLPELRSTLGFALGEKVYRAIRGQCDPMEFVQSVDQKSVSVNVNFGVRLKDKPALEELISSISTELKGRLEQIDRAGMLLSVKLLIRQPDAPIEPAKYGAHGPVYPLRKSCKLPRPTTDADVIRINAMRLIGGFQPAVVISDIRGIALHMTKLFTLAGQPIASSGGPKDGTTSLWQFIQTKTNKDGQIADFTWKPITKKKPIDSSNKSPSKAVQTNIADADSEDFSLRLSEVVNPISHRPTAPKRVLGNLPSLPPALTPPSNQFSSICIPDRRNKALNVAGVLIPLQSPILDADISAVLFHLREYVLSLQLRPLKHLISDWERHTHRSSDPAASTAAIARACRFVDWLCLKLHGSVVFGDDDPDSGGEVDFFEKVCATPKKTTQKTVPESPDLFCDDAVAEVAVSIESPKKARKRRNPPPQLFQPQKKPKRPIPKKSSAKRRVIDVINLSSDDDVIILD